MAWIWHGGGTAQWWEGMSAARGRCRDGTETARRQCIGGTAPCLGGTQAARGWSRRGAEAVRRRYSTVLWGHADGKGMVVEAARRQYISSTARCVGGTQAAGAARGQHEGGGNVRVCV
eukprot:114296-Chlamydomonas_euryale.AAC.1